jgi:hypothetical protein
MLRDWKLCWSDGNCVWCLSLGWVRVCSLPPEGCWAFCIVPSATCFILSASWVPHFILYESVRSSCIRRWQSWYKRFETVLWPKQAFSKPCRFGDLNYIHSSKRIFGERNYHGYQNAVNRITLSAQLSYSKPSSEFCLRSFSELVCNPYCCCCLLIYLPMYLPLKWNVFTFFFWCPETD